MTPLSRRWHLASHLAAGAIVAGIALCFEAAARAGLIATYLLPPPSAVLASIPLLFAHERLAERLGASVAEVLAGAALGTIAGVFAGWALHRWHPLRQAFLGWVIGLGAAPLILLYPLLLIFFGRGLAVIVVMSAISALMPIILKTCEGLDGTKRVQIDVGRSFGLSPARLFWQIRLPAAFPAILGGIRLGVAYALVGVISTEYLTNYGGLGELITDLADRYEMAAMYGAILFAMAVSAALLALIEGFEKWLTRR